MASSGAAALPKGFSAARARAVRRSASFLLCRGRAGRVGCLLRGDILAGAFAELFRGLRAIKNVVDDLERQARLSPKSVSL